MVSACPCSWQDATPRGLSTLAGPYPWELGGRGDALAEGGQLVLAVLALLADICRAHQSSAAACLSHLVLHLRNKETND